MSALTNLEQTAERSVPNCLAIAGMGDYCGRVFLHIPPPCPVLGDGLLCNLMIRIRGPLYATQQHAGDPQIAT